MNYGFALDPPERTSLATLFWPQMARIRPESYVADNDYLTFASANKTLFARVNDAAKAISYRTIAAADFRTVGEKSPLHSQSSGKLPWVKARGS